VVLVLLVGLPTSARAVLEENRSSHSKQLVTKPRESASGCTSLHIVPKVSGLDSRSRSTKSETIPHWWLVPPLSVYGYPTTIPPIDRSLQISAIRRACSPSSPTSTAVVETAKRQLRVCTVSTGRARTQSSDHRVRRGLRSFSLAKTSTGLPDVRIRRQEPQKAAPRAGVLWDA